MSVAANIDPATVEGFGREWSIYDQRALTETELRAHFQRYFEIFPWEALPPDPVGFDMGCGSGRWARLVAPRVGVLHCIDASAAALEVARTSVDHANCRFHLASVDESPLPDGSMDFGYSLGVLHHLPDTLAGIRSCVQKLKIGAPLLLYLYYAFDQRPGWYRLLWRSSDVFRQLISRLPPPMKVFSTRVIAATVYFPLARAAALFERLGVRVDSFPLAFYRRASFYTMKTDALDRFGTRLERRFTARQIEVMMVRAGLTSVRFSEKEPFWCAVGFRAS